VLGLESSGKLDPPFILELGHAQESSAHNSNDYRSDDPQNTFPDILCTGESVCSEAIESTNHACADSKTNE
jgi:hypothetical protein